MLIESSGILVDFEVPVIGPHFDTVAHTSIHFDTVMETIISNVTISDTHSEDELSPDDMLYYLETIYPSLNARVTCPACIRLNPVSTQVQHLNDEHEWTREAIADWLETLHLDLTIHPAQIGD